MIQQKATLEVGDDIEFTLVDLGDTEVFLAPGVDVVGPVYPPSLQRLTGQITALYPATVDVASDTYEKRGMWRPT